MTEHVRFSGSLVEFFRSGTGEIGGNTFTCNVLVAFSTFTVVCGVCVGGLGFASASDCVGGGACGCVGGCVSGLVRDCLGLVAGFGVGLEGV